MKLIDAVNLTFETRDSWREGKGAATAQININHAVRILGGDIELEAINAQQFIELTRQLKAEGKSAGTINRITSALSTVMSEMRCLGHDIPRVSFKRQKEKQGRPGFFKEEEIAELLATAKHKRDWLLHDSILFSIKTGCRQSEMLELTEDDVDLKEMTIRFLDTKNGTDHIIKLHEELLPIIERRLHQSIDGTLFPWLNKDQLLREFKNLKSITSIGNDDRVWHHLRHTTATWLCERGAPMRSIMGVLNHKRVETTLRYSKASDRSIAAAIDLL